MLCCFVLTGSKSLIVYVAQCQAYQQAVMASPGSGDVETVVDGDSDASCISTGNKQKSCFVSDLASI